MIQYLFWIKNKSMNRDIKKFFLIILFTNLINCSLFGQNVYKEHNKKRDLGDRYYPYYNSISLKPNSQNKNLIIDSIKKNVEENNTKTKNYLSFYNVLLASDPKQVEKNIIKDNKTDEQSIFLEAGSIKDNNKIAKNILPYNAKVVQELAKKNKVALSSDVKANLEEMFALYDKNQEVSESITSKSFAKNEVYFEVNNENAYSIANDIKEKNLKWYDFYHLK